jgi:hypothetical protein
MSTDIYWISDLARGRLAIVGRPRSGDWLADEISAWRAAGLTDVVSLLEDHEIRDLELGEEPQISMRAGLSFERFPIADRGVPASPDAALRLCDGTGDFEFGIEPSPGSAIFRLKNQGDVGAGWPICAVPAVPVRIV